LQWILCVKNWQGEFQLKCTPALTIVLHTLCLSNRNLVGIFQFKNSNVKQTHNEGNGKKDYEMNGNCYCNKKKKCKRILLDEWESVWSFSHYT
jgi:hypothetical protein